MRSCAWARARFWCLDCGRRKASGQRHGLRGDPAGPPPALPAAPGPRPPRLTRPDCPMPPTPPLGPLCRVLPAPRRSLPAPGRRPREAELHGDVTKQACASVAARSNPRRDCYGDTWCLFLWKPGGASVSVKGRGLRRHELWVRILPWLIYTSWAILRAILSTPRLLEVSQSGDGNHFSSDPLIKKDDARCLAQRHQRPREQPEKWREHSS